MSTDGSDPGRARIGHLAVVMPAYNEAEGLPGFIDELREHLAPLAERVTFVVADDCSSDDTVAVLRALRAPDLVLDPRPRNRGHGPTALAAYRAGLALAPDVIVHVDGDGQFLGADFPRLLAALAPGVDVVHGVRDGRTDPWFRTAITGTVRMVVRTAVGTRIPDVNTPLRAYRPAALEALLAHVSPDSDVPHVHFSIAEARAAFTVAYVPVRSIPRRGSTETGTMWNTVKPPKLPPKRLRSFVRRAARELWRDSLSRNARMRRVRRPDSAGAA